MAIVTMLKDRQHSVEAWMNLVAKHPRGDPESCTLNECKTRACADHVRHLCATCAAFFKIGRPYDWEEQYNEYSEYWEKHFQLRGHA